LEVEDAGEDERKDLGSKIESLESIVRMLELKAKNSSDHGMYHFIIFTVKTSPPIYVTHLNCMYARALMSGFAAKTT
jgi:hypothetical protein